MSTARISSGSSTAARGRGLDALFDGATAPVVAPARSTVATDLAALLDDEFMAAETGGTAAAAEGATEPVMAVPTAVAPAAARGISRDVGVLAAEPVSPVEGVDLPPSAAEALPIAPLEPEPVRPSAPPEPAPAPPQAPVSATPTPAEAVKPAEPERKLPPTKRFGAIIMDTTTEPTTDSAAGAQALVPTLPQDRSVLPPTSGEGLTPAAPPPPPERTEDQKTLVISRLSQVYDTKKLNREIDDLYKQVATEFSSPQEVSERALSILREARQVIIETPENTVSAEYRMMQVRAMLERMQASRKDSGHFGPRILLYETGWLVLLLVGMIFAGPLTNWITQVGGVTGAALLNLNPLVNTMLWGGIGGIVGALYSLWWHISEQQDFDRQYMIWYLVQPLLGLVLGGIVFLLMAGGFLLLQVNLQDEKAATGARLLPYLTAVLAGFRQNFIYGQFDRLIALFTPAQRRDTATNMGDAGPSQ